MKALPVVLILALLAACSAPAIEAAIAARIFATLAAAAPSTATPERPASAISAIQLRDSSQGHLAAR